MSKLTCLINFGMILVWLKKAVFVVLRNPTGDHEERVFVVVIHGSMVW